MSGPSPADLHVLILDDENDSRVLLERAFEDLGCWTTSRKSPAEALDTCQKEPPDLICLDLLVREADGWSFLGALKSDPLLRSIPVVVVSVEASESRRSHFGVFRSLDKPVPRELLAEVVREICSVPGPGMIIVTGGNRPPEPILVAVSMAGFRIHLEASIAGAIEHHRRRPQDHLLIGDGTAEARLYEDLDPVVRTSLPSVVWFAPAGDASRSRSPGDGRDRIELDGDPWPSLPRPLRDAVAAALAPGRTAPDCRLHPRLLDRVPRYVAKRWVDVVRMETALESHDLGTVRDVAHQIRGSGGSFGFLGLSALAGELEHAASRGDHRKARRQLDVMRCYLGSIQILSPGPVATGSVEGGRLPC